MVNIDTDCEATEVDCPDFTVQPEDIGTYKNTSEFLPAYSQCTINIDATAGVGRVIFDDANSLGVLVNGYVQGEPITIPAGER
mmetsp:Transcript_18750/g.28796  ORF Transcript_18750/g.28796 Transcript_18750/m.28796 type:complete len:83 (+) Transcript_18750:194-442(+)